MKNINIKGRKFIDESYLDYIRRLPCSILGVCGVDPHHVSPVSRKQERNDYYAIPLGHEIHSGSGHIQYTELEERLGEDPRDVIIFYLSLYIQYLKGEYDVNADMDYFSELRRKKEGVI